MTKSSLLASAAILALFVVSPALADHHDHDSSTPSTTSGSSSSGSGGSSSGGSHGHGSGGSSGGSGTSSGGSGGSSGAPAASGAMMGTSTGHSVTIDTHHHDHSAPPGSTGSSGTPGSGAPSGSVTITNTMGGTHHDHDHSPGGTTNVMGGASMGTMGGTHHETIFHNNTGVTVFAPHTHWGHHDNNHAFDQLRRVLTAPHHFHHGFYHRPNGWYWHRWTYGEFLPFIFFEREYWIDDWDEFDLDDPPPGTVWIRYGNDALLIDEDSGEVIEVVYGVFY